MEAKKNTANIPAATSSITMLAPVSERIRKIPRRTRGWRSLVSRTMKPASSAAASAASSSVEPDTQPAVCALTRAYTRAISPPVMVTAPAMSIRPAVDGARLSGTKRRASSRVMAPTGRLTKNTHCQEASWVRTPPSSRPTAPPPMATALQTPRARARSLPSAKVVVSTERAAGDTSAPPRPCRARPATSSAADPAKPLNSEAAEKSAMPIMKSRRRPKRSPARPPSRRNPPKVSA